MTATAPDGGLVRARQVADAVLYEGYVLFPYRASSLKNRYRWQWGVVAPRPQSTLGAGEPAERSCEVRLRARPGSRVDVTVRFLHLRLRQVEDTDGRAVDELAVDGVPVPTWEEGVEREATATITLPAPDDAGSADPATETRRAVAHIACDAARTVELLGDAGRAVRTTWEVTGELRVDLARHGAPGGVEWDDTAPWTLRMTVRNETPWSQRRATRADILRRSFVGVHLIARTVDGAFASVIDPPPWATGRLRQRGLHPVLIDAAADGGADAQTATIVLAAPIILYDHPQIAPESPGPSFDATEVDELLALAVMGLTDDEKRRARATDPRAAELIDRTDALAPDVHTRLHGAIRAWGPADLRPEPTAGVSDEVRDLLGVGEAPLRTVRVADREVAVGDRVRLRPRRRADAHDLFADGRVALVERIVRTVEGDTYLAVTIDDDPAADLHRWYGRFQYFGVDEVAVMDPDADTTAPPGNDRDLAGDGTSDDQGGAP